MTALAPILPKLPLNTTQEKHLDENISLNFDFLVSGIGASVQSTAQQQMQKSINKMLGWNTIDEFPASLPFPLIRESIPHIDENMYLVCERSEGVRCLILILQGTSYLINQNYEFKVINLFFPMRLDRIQPGIDKSSVVLHNWTLLDGELMLERENGKNVPHYLIYDILLLNGHSLLGLSLFERLKAIQNDVIAPKKGASLPPNFHAESFQVSLQSMYPVKKLPFIVKDLVPRLNRDNAGLIFMPITPPYQLGINKLLLVWRPVDTVEFQLGVEWRGRPPLPGFKLMTRNKGLTDFHDWITLDSIAYENFRIDPKAPSRIIECVFDFQQATFIPSHDKSSWEHGNPLFSHPERGVGWRQGGWRFLRVREDKNLPSDIAVVNAIESSLEDPLVLNDFLNLFSDDTSKLMSYKPRKETTVLIEEDKLKKKRPFTEIRTTTGVCYDFQNKGFCHRGEQCHFSHCACDTVCSCSRDKNSYGQRPLSRQDLNEIDSVSVDKSVPVSTSSTSFSLSSTLNPVIWTSNEACHSSTDVTRECAISYENIQPNSPTHEKPATLGTRSYSSLGLIDTRSIQSQRNLLCSTANAKIWNSIGITSNRERTKRVTPSFTISSSGHVSYPREG